jgi:hypothetical protein
VRAVLGGFLRRLIVTDATLAVFEPITVAIHLEDMNVVSEAIEQCAGQAFGGQHAGPFIEGQIAGDDDRTAFVALAEDLEQQLGAGRRERDVAQFIDDQKLVAGKRILRQGLLQTDGADLRLIQAYLRHREVRHTTRYVQLSHRRSEGLDTSLKPRRTVLSGG